MNLLLEINQTLILRACQRFSRDWKELAKDTKPWNPKIIKLTALNCAFYKDICNEHYVEYYPTLKLFPSFGANKKIEGNLVQADKSSVLQTTLAKYVDALPNVPNSWPNLKPF